MSRDGSGIYSKPGGTTAVTGTPVSSSAYNTAWDDLVTDLNAARPISSGGTGATTASGARTNLGVSATDATITAIAALDFSVAGSMLYSTAADTFSLVTSTAAGRALLDDADAAAQRTTLGLVIGTNVQAYDADLTTWAGLTPSAYFQTLVDDVDAATARTTLGLGTSATVNTGTSGATVPLLNGTNTWSAQQIFTATSGLLVRNALQGYLGFQRADATLAYSIGRSLNNDNAQDFYLYDNIGLGTVFSVNSSRVFNFDQTPTIAGVAIPTISSTDTLTNKTLSSPTLSGTVAGSPTFNGSLSFSGNSLPITITDGAYIKYYNASGNAWLIGKPNTTDMYIYKDATAAMSFRGGSSIINIESGFSLQANGVAVPTISSTDTLSNKTLSSPTLSGTVAGSPTFSGTLTISGVGGLIISQTEPRLDFYETNAGADAKRWSIINDGGSFTLQTRTDADVFAEATLTISRSGTAVSDIKFGAGVTIGYPTGGNKGAGTLNCTAAYDDNVLLTDLVLDYAVTNTFDAVKYANHPLRDQVASWMFNPDQYAEFWKTERRLPGMLTWDDPADKPSTGESITRLTAVVEMQAALIENLNQRLKELER